MHLNDESLSLIPKGSEHDDPGIDLDLSVLNRLYLAKAREMARAGAHKKASFLLGLPPDALEILNVMPLSGINALSESGILLFGWRTAHSVLRDFAHRNGEVSEYEERRLHLLASHGSDGRRGVSHGRDLA